MNWREWFSKHSEMLHTARGEFSRYNWPFATEELYQAFKARLIEESRCHGCMDKIEKEAEGDSE